MIPAQAEAHPHAQRRAPLHLIIYANPTPGSYDNSIVGAYLNVVRDHGHAFEIRDLYHLNFDPVLKIDERPGNARWAPRPDVLAEVEHVRSADVIVLVYPIWYGMPPAILKGYVDRVLGSAYSFRDVYDERGQPPLVGKPLVSFSTSGLPLSWLTEKGQVLSLRGWDVYLWRGFGMKQSEHVMLENIVPNMSAAHAAAGLERVRATATRTCAMLDDALVQEVYES